MSLASLHRFLLPCLNGLDTASSLREYSSSSSLPDRPPGGAQQSSGQPDAPGTRQQPLQHVSQLTQEQKQELKQAVVGR